MKELNSWQEVSDFLRSAPAKREPASRLASKIAGLDGEVARFLASGMLDYLACRLGGKCHCGKSLEERECVVLERSLLPAFDLSIKHWDKGVDKVRAEAIKQIRAQWPDGMLISDAVAGENEPCDHLQDFLADLRSAAQVAGDGAVAPGR